MHEEVWKLAQYRRQNKQYSSIIPYSFTPETSLFSGAATRSRRPRLDGRIVGGQDANIEDYPYQVNLWLSAVKNGPIAHSRIVWSDNTGCTCGT